LLNADAIIVPNRIATDLFSGAGTLREGYHAQCHYTREEGS
jgi:hypothetical protein